MKKRSLSMSRQDTNHDNRSHPLIKYTVFARSLYNLWISVDISVEHKFIFFCKPTVQELYK